MIFGVPNELSDGRNTSEMRVGISPMGVHELVHYGAAVYVESNAGDGAGFTDENYVKAGAEIVYSKEEAYRRADVVLKVRRPLPEEYRFINNGQVIAGFMHLITAPREFIDVVKEKNVTLIGYEIIEKRNGDFPIVIPMSEMAGVLSVQIAARLLESRKGGRGILLGGLPGIPPAEVVILGAGTLGRSAAMAFAGIGANVYVLDIDREKLAKLAAQSVGMRVTTMFSTQHNIKKLVKFADVIIGAVQLPRKRTPVLLTEDMVKTMQTGAVFIDFSIDQGGCSETSKIAPLGDFVYPVHDVIHFCMPNATTLVARTATHALTAGAFPYLQGINDLGLERAFRENSTLGRGVYADKGKLRKEFSQ
jgi:alanine dehydrogenase